MYCFFDPPSTSVTFSVQKNFVSDIAMFVLKRDVKLQLTNSVQNCSGWPVNHIVIGIKSRSSLLAPAHPGGPGKRSVKRLWCGVVIGMACIL